MYQQLQWCAQSLRPPPHCQDWGMKLAQRAGEVCTRRWNRFMDANLETEVMIKKTSSTTSESFEYVYDLYVLIMILVSTIYYQKFN